MSDDEPRTRTRRTPGWRDVPDMEPPAPEHVELLGFRVIATVLERMTANERRRCLAWLADKYEVVEAEIVPWDGGE